MIISTHLRTAAGVCALTTGLLIGSTGGAVALADTDTDSSGAATGNQSADNSTRPATSVRGPIGSLTDSLSRTLQSVTQNTVQGVTGTLTSLTKSGQPQSSIGSSPKTTFGGSPTVYGSSGPSTATPDVVAPAASDPSTVPAAAPEATTLAAPAAAPETAVVTPPSPPVTPLPNPTTAVMVPVSKVIAVVTTSVVSAPALVASLPLSTTPVSDVITTLQGLLVSAADASSSLVNMPADLTALLGVGTAVPGTTTTGVGPQRFGPVAVADVPTPVSGIGQLLLAPLSGFDDRTLPGVPAIDQLTGPATPLDVTITGTSHGASSAGTSLMAPLGAGSSVLSIVERVIGAFVATVSLTALAAVALPGIAALLGTCAAGIRIGYRQAKAGSETQTTVIARFVGSGPLGVVRSGSQISLRPRLVRSGSRDAMRSRTPRRVGRSASSSVQLLDQAV